MPTVKFLNQKGKYHDDNSLYDVLSYILQPSKTPSHVTGGVRVDMQNPAQSMVDVAQIYKKDYGVRLRHFVVAFKPQYASNPIVLGMVAQKICNYIGLKYQAVFAVHEDTPNHPHFHIVFNSVSDQDGYKYLGDKADYNSLLVNIKGALVYYDMGYLQVVKS